MTNYHVSKRPDGKWQAKKEGADKVSRIFDTQREAKKAAQVFSTNSGGGEVTVSEWTEK